MPSARLESPNLPRLGRLGDPATPSTLPRQSAAAAFRRKPRAAEAEDGSFIGNLAMDILTKSSGPSSKSKERSYAFTSHTPERALHRKILNKQSSDNGSLREFDTPARPFSPALTADVIGRNSPPLIENLPKEPSNVESDTLSTQLLPTLKPIENAPMVHLDPASYVTPAPPKTPLAAKALRKLGKKVVTSKPSPASPVSPISSMDVYASSRPISPRTPIPPVLGHPKSACGQSKPSVEQYAISIDDAVRAQTFAVRPTSGGRPIQRAVSVHQRGPFKYELKDFALQKTLGQGAFAKVYLVKRTVDGRLFALKSMRKDHVIQMKQVAHVQNERHLMEKIQNPFLVSLEATFQDVAHIYMIIEYMSGGDLFNQIKRYGYFEEPVARCYASEVAMALSFLHSENIVYRDLKPENVLLDGEGHVKLGDFGFAKVVDSTTRTFCGTPSYIPPEILLRKDYSCAVDWWSFGVLVFEMLSGCSPFQDNTFNTTYERILQGRIQWPSMRQKYFSRNAENLILSLLVFNPDQRLGCIDECEIRDHPFFSPVDWGKVKLRKQRVPLPPASRGGLQRSSSFGQGFAAESSDSTEFELSAWRSASWAAGGASHTEQHMNDLFKDF
ncbi:camp-dependent protein kinase catalytic subunit [Gaertneriomyces sp. JEL0708]|nr:camp-dependent protein kinase catalytic subunit [Gaertneriomyces sp. JEL0708]